MKNRNALQNGGQLSLLKCIHNCPATLAGKMLQPQSSRGCGDNSYNCYTTYTLRCRLCSLILFFCALFGLLLFRSFIISTSCFAFGSRETTSRARVESSRVELKVAVWLHLNYCIKEKSLSTAISAAQREEEVGRGGRWRWSSPPGIAIK